MLIAFLQGVGNQRLVTNGIKQTSRSQCRIISFFYIGVLNRNREYEEQDDGCCNSYGIL